MAKSNEPFWWALFSAGMMVGAFLVPAMIVITGVLIPLGYINDAGRFRELIDSRLTRLFLFAVISLSFFHWAHRFRFTLVDLGLKGASGAVAIGCYGTAIVGTLVAGAVALRLL